jgi:hypothetical protein
MSWSAINRLAGTFLERYETRAKVIHNLRRVHRDVITRLETLEAEQEADLKILKKHIQKEKTPPEALLVTGERTLTLVTGLTYRVDTSFKLRSPYYNPVKLPKDLFIIKGVVVEVDTKKVTSLIRTHENPRKIESALVTDEWLTPAVSVKPR